MKKLYAPDSYSTIQEWTEWTYEVGTDGVPKPVYERIVPEAELAAVGASLQNDQHARAWLQRRFLMAVEAYNVDEVKLFGWLLKQVGE